MKKLFVSLFAGMTVFYGLALVTPVRAQEATTTSEVAPVPVTTSAEPVTGTYTYVAQSGDSYSVLARKSIQIYGIDNQVALSGAQIIFAETNITQANGSQLLNEGQTVTIEISQVADWVAKAQQLTPEEEAAWAVYVPFTDFNTNAAGEAQS